MTSLAILGNEFVKRRKIVGWKVWLVANVIAIALFSYQGQWPLVCLYVYYAVSCLHALRLWRKPGTDKTQANLAPSFGPALPEPNSLPLGANPVKLN